MAAALDEFPRLERVDVPASAALREEIARARTALDRARRTGAAVNDVIDACFATWGLAGGYDRGGLSTVRSRPAGVDATA